MRVSTSMLVRISNTALMKRQEDIARTQSEIASGKTLQKPSDDPIGITQKIDHQTAISQLSQYNRNINIGESRLESAEQTLTSVIDSLQRTRELALTAANATNSSNEHKIIASELAYIRNDILALANSKDTTGNYLFSGTNIDTQPFSGNTNIQYNGNSQNRTIQARNNLEIETNISGSDVFLDIPQSHNSHIAQANTSNTGSMVVLVEGNDNSGSTQDYILEFTTANNLRILNAADNSVVVPPTPVPSTGEVSFNGMMLTLEGNGEAGDVFEISQSGNQDIFSMLLSFTDALNNSIDTATGKAFVRQTTSNTLTSLDMALDSLNTQRSLLGTRLQTMDTIEFENDFTALQLQENLSSIQDTDLTEAITKLQQNITALEVLQQTTARTQSLNLFNIS